ncbi:cytosolic beta-glucosidase-like [Daphnia pulicaria]|uniref:cytosolic beta-glucosidase-like n=1 Tax=Daphnia pulicaria TaxID=35523 RepID=UPI001EEB3E12|nr:cytosolic beta-glucosidase-like [Daphnia pulicaria]
MAMKFAYWLLVIAGAAAGVYVDEPLLYDTFPPDFIWAAATSAHQIEGGWDADGKGLNIWDVYTTNSSVVLDGSTGQTACNSYYFYQKDVNALQSLGVSHYRFSISWARVLPNGIGEVNQPGVDYYKRLIAALKAANIEPMVTLYHWDLPQALEDMGGWLNPSIADWFEEYARLCYTEFGNDVKIWITINEPWVVAYQGYGSGINAPGKYGPGTYTYQSGHNLILAHARAYRLYESEFKPTQQGKAGITLNINWYDPKDNQTSSQEAAERAMQFLGGWFANPIFGDGGYPAVMRQKVDEKSAAQGYNPSRLPVFTAQEKLLVQGSSDFFGLNYYTGSLTIEKIQDISIVDYGADQDIEASYDPAWYGSGSGWLKITPFGMRNTLKWIRDRFNNPDIIVTENGFSDNAGNLDDLMRVYYYKHNINNVLKAIKTDGVKVIGYAAWSLMDNYEWGSGYTQKFGIFSVDFATADLNRTVKASGRYYAQLIRDNGFTVDQPCNNYPIY